MILKDCIVFDVVLSTSVAALTECEFEKCVMRILLHWINTNRLFEAVIVGLGPDAS